MPPRRTSYPTDAVINVNAFKMSRPPAVYLDPGDPATPDGGTVPGPGGSALGVTGYAANVQALGHYEYGSRPARLPDSFPDGLSSTILFAERSVTCGAVSPVWLKTRADATGPMFALRDGPTGPPRIIPPQFQSAEADCNPNTVQAAHPGVLLVLLADDSVWPVGPGVSPATWRAAVLPADGQRPGGDW
jgi:hypothetical protein